MPEPELETCGVCGARTYVWVLRCSTCGRGFCGECEGCTGTECSLCSPELTTRETPMPTDSTDIEC